MKKILFIINIVVLTSIVFAGAGSSKAELKIYMPRDIAVSDDIVKLGEVAILRSDDPTLLEEAGNIQLARFTKIDQKITIDRQTIKSRIACEDIDVDDIEITGADEIAVKQNYIIIESSKIVEIAELALKSANKDSSICGWTMVRLPRDVTINSTSKNVEFKTSIIESNRGQSVQVFVEIYVDNVKTATKSVIFRYQFTCKRAVAKRNISAGDKITTDNVTIETYKSAQPQRSDWREPYGLVAQRLIRANTVVSSNIVAEKKSDIIIRRNDNVVVKIETPLMLISAMGLALEDGRAGDCIKVRMLISASSRRVIYTRIQSDGTLTPIS